MSELQQVGRIAMRHEGEMWNAYYALPDSMGDALLLGSIRISAVKANDELKQVFINLMREMVSDIFEEKTGNRSEWNEPTRAPEHERAGNT